MSNDPVADHAEEIQEALLGVFLNWKFLERFVLFKLKEKLPRLVSQGKMSDVIYEFFFEWAEAHGRQQEICEQAYLAFPRNANLKRCIAKMGWLPKMESPEQTKEDLSDSIETIRVGGSTVLNHIERGLFESLRKQISVVSNHKDLHDQLHKLHMHCFTQMIELCDGGPSTTGATVSITMIKLKGVVRKIGDILKRDSELDDRFSCINDDLASGLDDLDKLVRMNSSDALAYSDCISYLKRVFSEHATKVNMMLRIAVSELRLDDITNNLEACCEKLKEAGASDSALGTLIGGRDKFAQLDGELDSLMVTHDHWQRVEAPMGLVEESILRGSLEDAHDIRMLNIGFERLHKRVGKICADAQGEQWAMDLIEYGGFIQAALDASDVEPAKRFFDEYRSIAQTRFYQLDSRLKDFCHKHLPPILEPIDRLLKLPKAA